MSSLGQYEDYCTLDAGEAFGFGQELKRDRRTLLSSPRWRAQPNMGRKKRKAKPFRAVTAVKELARERVGMPPAEKVVIEKKRKPEKHKATLGKLLEEAE